MQNTISLRAHHVTRFAEYYLIHRLVKSNYGEEFRSETFSIYDKIIRKEAHHIIIVDCSDGICQVCIKTTKRKQSGCEKGDELQRDPSALLTMAKSQLVVGKTYGIGEFLQRVEKIRERYPQEKLLEMLRSAYRNMQGSLQPTP